MDKIWDENLSKAQIIGCCGWDEKTQKTTENGHSRMQKKQKNLFHYTSISFLLQNDSTDYTTVLIGCMINFKQIII